MLVYINELSLPVAHSVEDVVRLFDYLGKCYQKARVLGVRDIKIHSGFYTHEFAPGFFYINWIDNHNVDQDLVTLFKSVLGTLPFVDEIIEKYENENSAILQMKLGEELCLGLGLASDVLFNSIAFSFDKSTWSQSNYSVSITLASERENGELVENTYESNAKNISAIQHVDEYKDFINSVIAAKIQNGNDLWIRREELFPNLKFCEIVKSQVQYMHSNVLGFQQIISRLFDLQNTASNCSGRGIAPEDFPTLTTLESDTRLNNFRKELTIRCPDGEDRLFSWHSRFTPGAGRIHFIPYENQKVFIIGSIANQNRIK